MKMNERAVHITLFLNLCKKPVISPFAIQLFSALKRVSAHCDALFLEPRCCGPYFTLIDLIQFFSNH